MVSSHQSTSSFPLFGKWFTVDANQTDSAHSSRPPINDDCHFMVGWTPGEGGLARYCCPCCEPHWATQTRGKLRLSPVGLRSFQIAMFVFALAGVVNNQICGRETGPVKVSGGELWLQRAKLSQTVAFCFLPTMSLRFK